MIIITNSTPVEKYFYSNFAKEARQYSYIDNNTTSYELHVYDDSMPNTYIPAIDSDIVYKRFMSNVLNQITIDGVAIVEVTTKYGASVYIIASDD